MIDDSKDNKTHSKKNKDTKYIFLKASQQNSKKISMKEIKKELEKRYKED